MTLSDNDYMARMDAIHGAPPDDPAEAPPFRRPSCPVCGGRAPLTADDTSHDGCFEDADGGA